MNRAVVVVMLVLGLVTGCSRVVAGSSVVTAAQRALPTPAELADLLGMPMRGDSTGITDELRGNSPPGQECDGVVHAGVGRTYDGAPIRATVRRVWSTPPGSDQPVNVAVAIVELDSAATVQSWYRRIATRWGQCRGITVEDRLSDDLTFVQAIVGTNDVEGASNAEVRVSTKDGLITPFTNWRSLTSHSRYLIDVELNGRGTDVEKAGAIAGLVADKLP